MIVIVSYTLLYNSYGMKLVADRQLEVLRIETDVLPMKQ
ncbi:hypothetical protein CLI98_01780 [Bacillus velezensis]|nr:hypothetical protein NG74_03884 [Bacillus velezensis]ATD75085.1 hypothetical protein CLI98_01780 [Bacillus velezensis]